MSSRSARPDSLFFFERLAALERALVGERGGGAPTAADLEALRRELQGALEDVGRLRRTLEAVAGLRGDDARAGRQAVDLALAALGDGRPGRGD